MPFIAWIDNWWVLSVFNLIPSASEYTVETSTESVFGIWSVFKSTYVGICFHWFEYFYPLFFNAILLASVLSGTLFKDEFGFWNHCWKCTYEDTKKICLRYSLAFFSVEIVEPARSQCLHVSYDDIGEG